MQRIAFRYCYRRVCLSVCVCLCVCVCVCRVCERLENGLRERRRFFYKLRGMTPDTNRITNSNMADKWRA